MKFILRDYISCLRCSFYLEHFSGKKWMHVDEISSNRRTVCSDLKFEFASSFTSYCILCLLFWWIILRRCPLHRWMAPFLINGNQHISSKIEYLDTFKYVFFQKEASTHVKNNTTYKFIHFGNCSIDSLKQYRKKVYLKTYFLWTSYIFT